MRYGSLCSGIGGLDRAVEAVFGASPAWFCEADPHARAVLTRHWPDAPIWHDLTTQDWSTVEPVDLVAAGFPCQDLSYAGRGAGLNGERSGLWFDVLDAVGVLQPRWVVLENVGALRARGLDVVTHGLASLGFVGRWGTVRASDVGACHRRERIFVVAHADAGAGAQRDGGAHEPGQRTSRRGDVARLGAPASDPLHVGRERNGQPRHGGGQT